MTQRELEDKLTVLLAGRAAEQLIFQGASTGAADDLAKATDTARSMVTRYGMDAELGHATYEAEHPWFLGAPSPAAGSTTFSEATLEVIDVAVRRLVDAAFERASRLLTRHRAILETAAEALLRQETFERADLDAVRAQLAASSEAAGQQRAA